ncbi:MAG: DUF1854 domain-containing protein [Verrucomicrobiaceae bacterium]|nr:DUF1854 domain-containing protein [Verrucomicrobiaceae bacterium]
MNATNIISLPPIPGTVRYLAPATTELRRGAHGTLNCDIAGDRVYEGVTAVRLFPITLGDQFISLRHTDEKDKDHEIGIIERLSEFPAETAREVLSCLNAHYHERIIQRIWKIKHQYGQLFFTVDTNAGKTEFVMPWRHDRAEEYGSKGRVLLDSLNNRYLIPDLEALAPKERHKLLTYIYW